MAASPTPPTQADLTSPLASHGLHENGDISHAESTQEASMELEEEIQRAMIAGVYVAQLCEHMCVKEEIWPLQLHTFFAAEAMPSSPSPGAPALRTLTRSSGSSLGSCVRRQL
eukprot:1159640-Pelagomonas_calceolata.AAC.11